MNENNEVAKLKARIDELETRIAFQEDSLVQLDDVIAQQDALLSKQQMQLQLLAEKFKTMEARLDSPQSPPSDERPPHY